MQLQPDIRDILYMSTIIAAYHKNDAIRPTVSDTLTIRLSYSVYHYKWHILLDMQPYVWLQRESYMAQGHNPIL